MKRLKTRKNKRRPSISKKTRKTGIRRIKGGGEKERREKILKDNFRNMIMKAMTKLQEATMTNNPKQIKDSIGAFKNGFKSNQLSINTLIPVTNTMVPINKYTYEESTTPIIGFVPLLVVIINVTQDLNILKSLITIFIKNKGNINLKSYVKNITALSEAIKLQDKELVKLLLENGADVNTLTEEQRAIMDNLIREEEVKMIIEPILEKPVYKLQLPTELPSADTGYAVDFEPEFWKPIFEENEMLTIREKINAMMNADVNIPINSNKEISDLWSVCKINKAIIQTYYVETKNEPYSSFGTFYADLDKDFSNYNIVLCAALLIYGIICQKMVGQDYTLLFKGGKAIQLELSRIPETSIYKTEDIDVLILPETNIVYDEMIVNNLAGHIAYLVKWFLFNVSVQVPNPENIRANPFIYKLSYVKSKKKFDVRRNMLVDDFKQFSDIDFKNVPESIKGFFQNSIEYKFYISELDEPILFRCPNIGSLLDEKIYYYAKYSEFESLLNENKRITEKGYENLKLMECQRLLEKFKRAILELNKGLQKSRYPELLKDELLLKERNSIITRLNKLGYQDKILQEKIVNSLY